MLEIEIKAYCENLEEIRERVIALGGELKENLLEKDYYFNHPEKDFAKTDEALRIRVVNGKNRVTYKGPKLSTKAKTREEIETSVGDFNSFRDILLKLGFKPNRPVEKKRTIYLLNGIHICLDEVKGVGTFVELEKIGEDKDPVEKALFQLADKLGLNKFETKSYLQLFKMAEENNSLK